MSKYDQLMSASKPKAEEPIHQDTKVSRYQDTTTEAKTGTNSEHDVERIRKAVKQLGKESATLRLTDLEKGAVWDILVDMRRKGIRTTETEIIRIALNYILNDYEKDSDASIVVQALESLNS